MFLYANVEEFNNHIILLDLQSSSDHTSLSVNIIIKRESIQDRKQAIIKNSKKEREFVNKLKNGIGYIVIIDIQDCKILERVMQEFASIAEKLWHKYSKHVNITKHSKVWWNEKCNKNLAKY